SIIDFRFLIICFLTAFLLNIRTSKKIFNLFLIAISVLGLSAYWLVPTLNLSMSSTVETGIANLQTASLLNSMFLFSPSWPSNEFGQSISPYFYFAIVPILIFLPLFIKRQRKIIWLTFLFLIFAFLSKGTTPPFGGLYNFVISTKLGSIFRD